MKEIDNFLKKILKKRDIAEKELEKLKEMLEEKVDDLEEKGYTHEEALKKTFEDFGDPDEDFFENLRKERKKEKRRKTIHHYRNDLLFSLIASALIIGILFILNHTLLEIHAPWLALVLTLGVLFWPLSLLYKFLNKKGD